MTSRADPLPAADGQDRPGRERPGLSRREREVLVRVARGLTTQQISEELGISVKTVATYRARVTDKLRLESRADLVRYATESGLFESST